MIKTVSGISPDIEPMDNPAKKELSKPPMYEFNEPPSPNARLYRNATHIMLTKHARLKHCMRTERTFLLLTSPP